MPTSDVPGRFGALEPYGWSPRVLALWNDLGAGALRPGRVVRLERGRCAVVADDGREHLLRARDGLAVGDWVATTDASVEAVLPRWSALTRADPDPSGTLVQVLAANVDLVIITAPADRLNVARVERELVLAWESGARPLVVVTKADLGPDELPKELGERLVSVDAIATSTVNRQGIEELGLRLHARTGVLLGPSGAGKSTLTNALLGEDVQAIGEVRITDRRGRHTTSTRQLLCLPRGGVLIDTPGLRSLGLAGGATVEGVFPEIEAIAGGCRFKDCRHEREPDCAVLRAVEEGTLDDGRLASFRKLAREAAIELRRQDPLLRRQARRVWRQRALDARRHDKRRLS
jgi:ribosome biogenesis GTPase / thiamine phosphate phosphatase